MFVIIEVKNNKIAALRKQTVNKLSVHPSAVKPMGYFQITLNHLMFAQWYKNPSNEKQNRSFFFTRSSYDYSFLVAQVGKITSKQARNAHDM